MKDALMILKLFLMIFLVNACETDLINPVKNIPVNKPKLVVNAYLSPQESVIPVYLAVSMPILGTDTSFASINQLIPDAKVWITDLKNNLSDTLHYQGFANGFYEFFCDTGIIKLRAGTTYRLNVTAGTNFKAQSECTIPFPNTTLVIDHVDTFERIDPYNYHTRNLRIKYHFNKDTKDDICFQTVIGLENLWGSTSYISGKFFYEKNSEYKTFVDVQEIDISEADVLHLILLSTDKSYYLYNNALDKLQNSNGNPFAEPVYLYSNISGGLGVFAAYNSSEIILKL